MQFSSVVIREIEQPSDKFIATAYSLPNNLSIYPQLLGTLVKSCDNIEEKYLHVDDIPNLPSLDNLSDLSSSSPPDLLKKSSDKSKRQKWLKKMVTNISISKKDKKKIAVL